jgi:choline kinase
MKAIILAAGQGTRIKKYTQNLPKGMLSFAGKTIIERQIETYKECGIYEIIIVRGFEAKKINYSGIKYYENLDYENTNMVESLMCARDEFDDDIIVSYSDILFEKRLLKKMIEESVDYGCAVDDNWKNYWAMRYGKVDFDTESLAIDSYGNITELGLEAPSLEVIDSRYIGLLKFSKKALGHMVSIWKDANIRFADKPWQQSGKVVKKAYMTDLLNAVIESGECVKAIRFNGGWIEFDTNEDYENAISWLQDGKLAEQIIL